MPNENSLDTKEAIILFDAGALKEAVAVPHPMRSELGYNLFLRPKVGSSPYVLAAQRDPIRLFKTADAVISTAKKIGFRTIKFEF